MVADYDPLHVAIDGPAGSGKSSVASEVAGRLGLTHVDTGAMYRALTRAALQESLGLDDGPALAARLAQLELRFEHGALQVDGEAAGDSIRTPEVDQNVSQVSAHEEVRLEMQRRQREISWDCAEGVVMEGRDIGAEVLPMARCKIFLTASAEERALRRARQAGRSTDSASIDTITAELKARDRLDSERPVSPLRMAIDAHLVDNTHTSRSETVDRIVALAEAARPKDAETKVPRSRLFRMKRYAIAYPVVRRIILGAVSTRVYGRDHQNADEGLVYACNHISEWDPPILGSAISRQVSFLAKKELFKGPLGWFIHTFGTIPIDRGRYDGKAFGEMLRILANGGSVAIFPEGTRKKVGRPGPVKRGLGILCLQSGSAYLPCFVRGTRHVKAAMMRRSPVEVWIGPVTRLHGVEALRNDGLDDAALQGRVGDLYLAQIKALAHRAAALRPRRDGA